MEQGERGSRKRELRPGSIFMTTLLGGVRWDGDNGMRGKQAPAHLQGSCSEWQRPGITSQVASDVS